MSLATAADYPQLKDQGVIPTLYADEVNITYYDECLLPRVTNSKFTGEVKNVGDKVIIAQRPVIETKDYVKGMTLETQIPVAPNIELNIERAKYYRFGIDNIDAHQTHIVLNREYISDGVERMKIDTETDFWADVYTEAHADNSGVAAGAKSGAYNLGSAAVPLGLDADNIIQLLTSVRAVLGEQNAAKPGMWIVVPEWCRWLLVNSDLKNASLTGDASSVQRTGRLGEIDGLTIYTSNVLKTATYVTHASTHIMAGNKDAITFCAQMAKSRAFEAQNTFGMIYDGLHVYDWEVIKPEGLVSIVAYKA